LASSCALYRPFERDPGNTTAVPEQFQQHAEAETDRPTRWWEEFGDPELNGLVAAALTNNNTLAQANARLDQARMLARQQGATRFPELTAEAGTTSSESSGSTEAATEQANQTRDTTWLGIAAGYEVDLWGRVLSLHYAASLDAAATLADRDTVAMTVAAEVVLRYVDLLATRHNLDLLQRQVEANKSVLELMDVRFRSGHATALDVLQQREIVAETESLLPLQSARETTLSHQLAVLVGARPSTDLGITGRTLPAPPPFPDTGLPADLLTRRPDIRAAWNRLRAGDWNVNAARADRLPAIRLAASGRYLGTGEDIFANWILSLAANLAAPLIDAGRRKAEVRRREAVVAERLAAYRETALNALREVQDALAQEYSQGKHVALLRKRLALSVESRKQATERYGKGQESYLRVLDATVAEEALRRRITDAEYQRLAYRVNLYRAIGGDWSSILEQDGEKR